MLERQVYGEEVSKETLLRINEALGPSRVRISGQTQHSATNKKNSRFHIQMAIIQINLKDLRVRRCGQRYIGLNHIPSPDRRVGPAT